MRSWKTRCAYEGDEQWLEGEAQRLAGVTKRPERTWDWLMLTRGKWTWEVREDQEYLLRGSLEFHNLSHKREIFVPEVDARVKLLADTSTQGYCTHVKLIPKHTSGYDQVTNARKDGYWPAFILVADSKTSMEVELRITTNGESLKNLESAWLRLEYISYGPHGRIPKQQHVVLPLRFPVDEDEGGLSWSDRSRCTVLPIKTHLLTHMDNPKAIFDKYVKHHYQPGDILAIGETPLAIMQGRTRHPASVRPGILARMACLLFHPTSSLATACGMQALIDSVGKMRIVLAVFVGALLKILGRGGYFYRVAGDQAALIDDVTGTLPPYDQFISYGPVDVQSTVDEMQGRTGCEVAVVDVNDLSKYTGAVRILGASSGVDNAFLKESLLDNPAGNADQQTPFVLIRRKGKGE